ncbi:MAG TPA: hypothetical protein VMW10_08850, partial [Alphaproteobacteria bacterium]|nr:hypothetical protein [Alphaproteobacteria bacterium]
PLRSLDVSFNAITNSSDIARILGALPSDIRHLDLSNLNGGFAFSSGSSHDFLGLGRLMGLRSFNVSNNSMGPDYIGVIGQALHNFSHLKELRLAWNVVQPYSNTNITQIAKSLNPSLTLLDLTFFSLGPDPQGQIVLGNSLAQNLTLKELYLRGTRIGANTNTTLYEAATAALAKGLSAQKNLRILDLSYNGIGDQSYNNGSILLSSLPSSLTHLDISYNDIGEFDSFDVKTLAQAVSKMSELTSFKAGGGGAGIENNILGNSPDFLRALHGKKNLTLLDLSWNYCNDSILIGNLLLTTPKIEVLNLQGNQLTNGSLLAPTLPTLKNLTILYLGGNNFTTADRVSIWKATSFLRKSPIPLDEDLNFTSTYLNRFPATITRLDLSGLIPTNPTALEIIMPQVVDLFPNLTALDLSNNDIFDTYANNTPILGGIQALTTYLPQLNHLQSLRMSNAAINNDNFTISTELITFSQVIGQLPNLHTLDFSNTPFVLANSLGKGLSNSHSLTSINLAECWFPGYYEIDTWLGGVQLIQGLQAQPNLIHLDLSFNPIGQSFSSSAKDPNSTLVLAKALNSWPQLQTLNLAGNSIGYEDSASASAFIEQLRAVYQKGGTLEVDLFNGITNVEWTQGTAATIFQKLTENKIKAACELEQCTGKPISKSTPSEPQAQGTQRERSTPPTSTLPFATSDAIRSHNVPWYSPARLVATFRSIWQGSPQTVDTTNPQVEKLVRFQEKCDRLIAKADTQTADPWYRFSLEDLREDVAEMANNPTEVNEESIKHLYRRLDGIEGDFLRKPLFKKPSFFAAPNQNIAPITESNAVVKLWTASIPLLGTGPVPLALGY